MSKSRSGRGTQQWMLWAFKLHGCADCGRRYPEIPLAELECDHTNPTSKSPPPAAWMGLLADRSLRSYRSNSELLAELTKCEVRCRACHQQRTRERRNGTGTGYVQGVLFTGTGEAWRIER